MEIKLYNGYKDLSKKKKLSNIPDRRKHWGLINVLLLPVVLLPQLTQLHLFL